MTKDQLNRLLKYIKKEGDCLVWTGARSGKYGTLNIDGVPQYVHRIVYEHFVGPIPPDKVVDHICEVTLCLDDTHLRLLGLQENVARSPKSNISKTHCIHGHEFTPETTHIYKGHRVCKTCWTVRNQRRSA